MDRNKLFQSLFDKSALGLEIGPSYNPAAPKREGFNVEILDYAGTAELRALYPAAAIEEVDYVSRGGPLAATVPHRARYDYIIASHVIEHQPDIVGFLNDCAALLKPGGRLLLAVPDKRYCFDVLRPLSTTGQAIQASLERRTRHPVAMAFDHAAYAAHRAGANVWNADFWYGTDYFHTLADAQGALERAVASSDYVDTHSWFFCPSSFRLMVRDLRELHHILLDEEAYVPGTGPEFFMVLSTGGQGCRLNRIDLQRAITAELRSVPD